MKQQELLDIYDSCADSAFRLALSFLGNVPDAEDMVQNVFIRLIEKHPHIKSGSEKAYVMTMTANLCRNQLKSVKSRPNTNYEDADMHMRETFESTHAVYDAVMALPEQYRTVLYLHYYEGYKLREIARIMNLSPSAVSMRLTRGREELKKLLSD